MHNLLKNMKIKRKLIMGFSVVILFLFAIIIIAIMNFQMAGANLNKISDNCMANINAFWTARRAMVATERELFKAACTTDKELTSKRVDSAEAELAVLKDVMSILEENYLGDVADIDKFRNIMASTVQIKEEIYTLMKTNHNKEAIKMIEEQYMPIFKEAGNLLVDLADNTQKHVDKISEDAARLNNLSIFFMILLGVISILFTIAICLIITKMITEPLEKVENAMSALSVGDFEHATIDYTSQDEFGHLADNIRTCIYRLVNIIEDMIYSLENIGKGDFTVTSQAKELYIGKYHNLSTSMDTIINELSHTLKHIDETAEQVSCGSTEIATASQALSQGATDQASNIEEITATAIDLSDRINKNAQNCQKANTENSKCYDQLIICNDEMNELLLAMDEMNASSNEIGEIIKQIEDIAAQTNLLSLNAAIEAAHAGDAGKGFAVVAAEIRELAAKSAESAKNTATLIKNSMNAVSNGTRIADNTADTLKNILEASQEISITIHQIAEESENQATSVYQVTKAMNQISSVVQNTSAIAQETAASSEELSNQSQTLKELINQFQLKQV
ncbi:methyl-accepting chemotaxis protein [Sporanaerobium hydrogeniformans]|uniref:Methyl-accepting chemotaxis protein n=1 Tax=Sporanaerobium hydrogeniformans TaxID=3072179 RepID=A0AC61D795_9FIRM|nr:HAMP domain-containing methyl-accepting chemotaxis protein [Sporanaerobium hydrogeniformans]PHV69359.1 methyl-accepting chemotaxis protein [Sporanaerobium hydrogeniformans]